MLTCKGLHSAHMQGVAQGTHISCLRLRVSEPTIIRKRDVANEQLDTCVVALPLHLLCERAQPNENKHK